MSTTRYARAKAGAKSARPDSRVVTSSTTRKSTSPAVTATTSATVARDVMGNAIRVDRTGAGTGQARLDAGTAIRRDERGLPVLETDSLGATVERVFDNAGWLKTERQLRTIGAAGVDTTEYERDRRGALTKVTEPRAEATTSTL